MPTNRTDIGDDTPMGATVVAGGVTFRLWAPAAQQVFVLTGVTLHAAEQPGFVAAPSDAMFQQDNGFWAATQRMSV